jgi:hypothetical protein
MQSFFDHLVVGAETLEQGVQYLHERFGVEIPFGGKHPQMGTHNCLTRLSQTSFLEIIAIDPEAIQPAQPRWFGLDDNHIRDRLAKGPRLLTWVVNTGDITATLAEAQVDSGLAQPISRGELRWYFGVPDDGRLLGGGMLPYIISWQPPDQTHPASNMADTGCRLNALKLYTPFPEWTENHLESIGASSAITVIPLESQQTAYLEAEFDTPNGIQLLSSNE